MLRTRSLILSLITAAALAALAAQPALAGMTERVSVSSTGEQGGAFLWPWGDSWGNSISADGRYVAFASQADNFAPGDRNYAWDVFVRDRLTGRTGCVSLSNEGQLGDYDSWEPSISADGRFVAFVSGADNLVPGDTNGRKDIFVRDRLTGRTEIISVSTGGEQGEQSRTPSISADARFVAFVSEASNLVPGDTNAVLDVFVRDRLTARTERVSVSSAGEQGDGPSDIPSITADGRFVAFSSQATNLVPGDTNAKDDVFVRDRLTGRTEMVSVSTSGEQGDWHSRSPSISADGRFVAFHSFASNLVPGDTNAWDDVFVRDRLTGRTEIISVSTGGEQGDWHSRTPSISADGRFVAFVSSASNLVAGDTNGKEDVLMRDRVTGATERLSVSSAGQQGDKESDLPCVSADGRLVVFTSYATNLVPGDTNNNPDIFVRDRLGYGGEPTTSPTTPYPPDPTTWYLHPGQTHAHYKAERVLGIPLAADLTPNQLADRYRLRGYSFMAATEHYPQYPLWTDATQPSGILRLHHSMEDTCSTHLLAFGFTPWQGWPPPPNTCLFSSWARANGVTRGGGVAVAAHPNESKYRWTLGMLDDCTGGGGSLTGLEIYNRGTDLLSLILGTNDHNPYALDLWDALLSENKGVWGFAGDDFTLPWPQFDGGCIVAVSPSQTADQSAIMSALKSGAFYASKGGWKNGLGAPRILGYWADSTTSTIHLVTSESARVSFVTGRFCSPPVWPTQRPDGSWEAALTYEAADRYVRAEARRPLTGATSWTQPIFIERLGMQTFTWQSPAPIAGRAAAPVIITFEGATLELAQPQSQVANVTASLVPVADRPGASPPMGYIGSCYRFLPQLPLDGTNTLTISYNPDDVRLFPEHTLSIYWYDTDQEVWVEVPSAVDTNAHTVIAGISKLGTFALSAPRPDELNAPNVSITSPASGAVLSGPATITATANDDSGVAGVSFYLDTILLEKDIWPADGWSCSADFSRYPNGAHTLTAVAEDACENRGTAQIPVTITGGTPPPAVSISAPAAGTTFWGRIDAAGAYADDQEGLELVVGLDENLLGVPTMSSGHWSISASVPPGMGGQRLLVVGGRDADGNPVSASVPVTVRVFNDVPVDSSQEQYIYAIARAGIAGGCYADPPQYCPFASVTRAQMAVFLCKAAGKQPLDRATPTFADVPRTHWAYGYIERLADPGSWGGTPPTSGIACPPGVPPGSRCYGPFQPVTREQMAKFLCTATGRQPMPTCSGTFADVPPANQFCRSIERLTDAASWPGGVAATSGCACPSGYPFGAKCYCPKSNATRGQMAVFLVRAFGIPL
jgi:Tol biopolymer transport system component